MTWLIIFSIIYLIINDYLKKLQQENIKSLIREKKNGKRKIRKDEEPHVNIGTIGRRPRKDNINSSDHKGTT